MHATSEERSSSYAHFVRRYFRSVHRWCAQHCDDRERVDIAAQRIILDLYRLEQGTH